MGGGEAARRARGRRHARGPGASRKQAEGGMQQAERGRHAQRQACTEAGMHRGRHAQSQACTEAGMQRGRHGHANHAHAAVYRVCGPELAPGHRVSRPRGTGSVGDCVGEGAHLGGGQEMVVAGSAQGRDCAAVARLALVSPSLRHRLLGHALLSARGTGSVGDSVGEGRRPRGASPRA